MSKEFRDQLQYYNSLNSTVDRLRIWARLKDIQKISKDYHTTLGFEYKRMLDNIHTSIAEAILKGKDER